MPTTITTSLTTRDTRGYVYPENTPYDLQDKDDVLYSLELRPQVK